MTPGSRSRGGSSPGNPDRRNEVTDDGVLGYVEVLAAATLWGSSGIFAVLLFRRGMTPESVALLRPAVGVVFLGLLLAVAGRGRAFPDRRGLLFLAGLGGSLTAVFQLAYQMAIESVGVPTTVALLYLAPAIVVAVGGPLLGEWPSGKRVALALVSVVGVWLTVLGARGAEIEISPAGVGWGVLAGASYAGYTLFGRVASRGHGSIATVFWSTAGSCVVLGGVLPFVGRGVGLPATAEAWGILVAFGFLTMAVASFLFYDALGRVEAGRASIGSTIEPVAAALLATVLLDQGLTAGGWVGLALVVVGVAGSYRVRASSREPPTHE